MLSTGKRYLLTVYQSAQHNIPEDLNLHSFYSHLFMREVMTLAAGTWYWQQAHGSYWSERDL
jgi:hypothetical protein